MADNQEEREELILPKTIPLKYPVVLGKGEDKIEVKEVTIEKRLKARHFKGIVAQGIKFDDMLTLVGRLVAQPSRVVDELDASDLFTLIDYVKYFLPDGLTTGDNR